MENLSSPDNSPEAMEARRLALQEQLESKIIREIHRFVVPQVFEIPATNVIKFIPRQEPPDLVA